MKDFGPATDLFGTWHITEMKTWDEEFLSMDGQAHIRIDPDGHGYLQFCMVKGGIDGEVVDHPDGKRFEFTWQGKDERDPASGSGWVRMKGKDLLEGWIKIHNADRSTFLAKRAE